MTSWEWPQYLLASWWIGWFFVSIGAILTRKDISVTGYVAGRWTGTAILAWILYMGGFWS